MTDLASSLLASTHQFVTQSIIDDWNTSGRDELLDVIRRNVDGDSITLVKILIELFGNIIDGSLTLDERLASVFEEVLTLPFPNAEQTLLMMFSFFGYHESLSKLPKLLENTISTSSWMLYVNDGNLLTQIGIVSPMFEKKIIRERTTIFYRQRRHNLLREETEGYSKLMVELSNVVAASKHIRDTAKLAAETAANIVSLIGYFHLDPIRTLDIFLNVFILDITYTSEVMIEVLAQTPFWEEGVPNYEAAQLLGMKLVGANAAQHGKQSGNTCAAVALLIQRGFIKFEAIYPFLEPLESQVTAQKDLYYEELRNKPSVSGMASLGNALAMVQFDGEGGDTDAVEEEVVTLDPTIHTHLLQALLTRGIMEPSFFILSKFPWLPGAFPLVSRLIYRLFEGGLSPLYDAYRPFEEVNELTQVKKLPSQSNDSVLTTPRPRVGMSQPCIYPFDSEGGETRFFDTTDSWKEAVVPVNNKEELMDQSKRLIGLTGPHLCYNLRLFAKLCRIATACLSQDPSWWYDYLRLFILPSVALISTNPLALAEVFKVVKQFPADVRFRLYGEWNFGILKSCPELRIATLNTEKETKRVLKRLSKQNVREMMRKLAKISYANPLPTFTAFVSQVESYDNLSDLVVEAAKYFTDLGWDALPFVIILQLTSSGRDTVQKDGLNDRKWLQSLAHFTGRLCSRYSVMMDCWPIFDLLIKQLHCQDSSMLVVLREILVSMTGVAQQQNISPEQALNLGFSPQLKYSVFKVIGDSRLDKEKPANRLFNTLGGQRALELFILLAQTQQKLAFLPDNSSVHQKVLALRHDEVTGVLNQYIEAVTWFVKPLEKFAATFASVVDLVTKYDVSPAYAFALWRPMLSQQIKSDPSVLKSLRDGLPSPEHISPSLYVTFWQLSLYDIYYDHGVYEAELARLSKSKKSSNAGELADEDKTHTLHNMKTKIRLSAEKDSYFPCEMDIASDGAKILRKMQISELLASCVLPRAILSAVDALYSAHFVITLHQLGTLNFSTLGVLDQIFNSQLLVPTLYTCTAGETENLGLFYHEILAILNSWRAKPEEYVAEGLGGLTGTSGEAAGTYRFPGFRLAYGIGDNKKENMLDHDMLRTVVEKWHRKIHITVAECLSRDDYMSRRNAIIFLRSVVGEFPLVAGHGVDVSKRLEKIAKTETREDIKLAALSLLGHVTRTEVSWIEVYDFKPMKEEDRKVEMAKANKRVMARKKAIEDAKEKAALDVERREKESRESAKPPQDTTTTMAAGKVKKGSKKAAIKADKPYSKKEDNSADDIQLGSPDAYPFIKKLAANDRPTRDETLNSLKRFLGTPKAFGELELLKLWKGLFFSMWFSDRPRTQQRLADDMASLLLVVHETNYFTFLASFWKIMSAEWLALDKHRIDKFYLLLRRYVGFAFQRLAKEDWDETWIERHNEVMSKIPLNPENPKIPDSIRYHVLEIYLEELAKVVLKDKKEAENEEEEAELVKELFADVPVSELLEAVETLSEETKNSVVQKRCVEDVLENPLLIEWGVAEELEGAGEEDEEDEEDEWAGFV